VAPTQAVTPLVPAKVTPPAPKPAAPPLPPLRPLVSKPPTPVPIPKAPPAAAPPTPAAPSAPAEGEGTQVFAGLRTPKIEASIVELKQDGSTGKTVRIIKETTIGRGTCDISYPGDVLLSPRHASLQVRAGKLILKDLGSQNGTFHKQRQDSELTPGDIFLLGRELFRFVTQSMDENQGSAQGTQVIMGAPKLQRGPVTAKLERVQLNGEVIEEFSLEKPETTLGRTKGDLVFNSDPYMSGTHARIVAQPGRFILQDLKSRNGVYRRIRNETELRHGDEFFLGEQLFRVEIKTS
jgi:pSer/pThr/pTyr-binding forkhead associated (FHA) protein